MFNVLAFEVFHCDKVQILLLMVCLKLLECKHLVQIQRRKEMI